MMIHKYKKMLLIKIKNKILINNKINHLSCYRKKKIKNFLNKCKNN